MTVAIAPTARTRPSPLLALAVLGVAPLLACLAGLLRPKPSGPVAAVFPPWWPAEAAVAAAGESGPVLRLGALPFVVIVAAADRQHLAASGAWLFLDARALGLCGPLPLANSGSVSHE